MTDDNTNRRSAWAPWRAAFAAVVAGAALAAPGSRPARGGDKMLDYAKIQRALPELRKLTDHGAQNVKRLHDAVELLGDNPRGEVGRRKARQDVHDILEDHLATKTKVATALRDVLEIPPTGRTDREVMDLLHSKMFYGVNWEEKSFRKCINDCSKALGVRIRMTYHVIQMNMVSLQFAEAPAATVLATLCNHFHLRYTVENGEIVIFKKLTPNEERFLEYEKKHPGVKLRYWDREDASGKYKKAKK